jgi:hypothetical protein
MGTMRLDHLSDDEVRNLMVSSDAEVANYRMLRGAAALEMHDRGWTWQQVADQWPGGAKPCSTVHHWAREAAHALHRSVKRNRSTT